MAKAKAVSTMGHGLLEQAPSDLPHLAQADEPTVVRWVARNVDNPDPDPRTCPDPFAWTLLRTCRENPAFLPFFVEKLWAKLIPARSQLEGSGPKEFDGKLQLEFLDRIDAMSAAASEAPAQKPDPAPSAKNKKLPPELED